MHDASEAWDFYKESMEVLQAAGIPFLVGGAYAMRVYTGIFRNTKDFDVMLRHRDLERALNAFRYAGYYAEVLFPHWIAKVCQGDLFIDLIYNSGNGLCPVDEDWFKYARHAQVLGQEVALCPPEELIWQKAYIMERERFDGADVIHLIKFCSRELDWPRLIERFGSDARVLLVHLLLVQYVYPNEPSLVPEWLIECLSKISPANSSCPALCNGPLLSRAQYLLDIERWHYLDARIHTRHSMTENELRLWTGAIKD